MTRITIELDDDVAERLEAEAARRDSSVTDLIDLGVRRVLVDRRVDVNRLANEIITEEEELLRRLA